MTEYVQNFRDLQVWQKAHKLLLSVAEIIDKLPDNPKGRILGQQLLRAASSIGANIAEGFGRRQGKEMEYFFFIAKGSSLETENWLLVLRDMGFLDNKNFLKLEGLCQEVTRMLGAFVHKSQSRRK
ncbi:MAG: hypothetical protein A2W63_00710 [Deltaproteobacteria bacterium RIFCSPLOWO2_02_44_9]|nr:MAG: hypothetical protein A2W63_00710 [Deltaproteobacteria bacterium RIFCSPLOWO2_02_44_9]